MGVIGQVVRADAGTIRQPDRYGGTSLPTTRQPCIAIEYTSTNEANITASQTDAVPRAIEVGRTARSVGC